MECWSSSMALFGCPGWLWRTHRRCDVTEMMDAHGRPLRQFHHEFQLAADCLHIAAECREIHIRLLLDLGDRRLLDVERGSDIRLGLAGNLAQLAQTLDLLLQVLIPRVDRGLLFSRQRRDYLIQAPAHLTFPSSRLSGFPEDRTRTRLNSSH